MESFSACLHQSYPRVERVLEVSFREDGACGGHPEVLTSHSRLVSRLPQDRWSSHVKSSKWGGGRSLSSQDTEAVGRSLPWKSRRLVGWLVALVVAPRGIVGSACVGIISALIHPSWRTKPQQKSEVASKCLAFAKGSSSCQQRVDLSR